MLFLPYFIKPIFFYCTGYSVQKILLTTREQGKNAVQLITYVASSLNFIFIPFRTRKNCVSRQRTVPLFKKIQIFFLRVYNKTETSRCADEKYETATIYQINATGCSIISNNKDYRNFLFLCFLQCTSNMLSCWYI